MKDVLVNGEWVRTDEVRQRAAQLRLEREAASGPLPFESRLVLQEEALQLLIDGLLIVQEGRRLLLTPSEPEITAVLLRLAHRFDGLQGCRAGADSTESRADISRRLCVDKVLEHWRSKTRRPKQSELRDYYRLNQPEFHVPESIHASHIVCHFEASSGEDAARQKAGNLRLQVVGGQAFGEVAALHSDCPENGGNLGWFARGLMVQEFDNAVFAAPMGELTPVFGTTFGFHFALVHAKKPTGIRSFNEVREEIENRLWLARQDQEVGRALAELQAKAVIRIGS